MLSAKGKNSGGGCFHTTAQSSAPFKKGRWWEMRGEGCWEGLRYGRAKLLEPQLRQVASVV